MRVNAVRLARGSALLLAIAAAAAIAPGVNSYLLYVLNLTLINAIAAIGLVVLSGVAGQISLGTAGLLATGAYGTSMLMVHMGMGFIPAAVGGAVLTMLIGTALAAPALRLSGLHLAIVTLAFGVIVVQLIGKGGPLTGGMSGLFLPPIVILGWAVSTEASKFVCILVPFCVVVVACVNFLRHKPGRALFALRDHESTAQAMGINTNAYKALAFALSSLLAGLAGALYAMLKGYVSVDDFTLWNSLYFFVMIAVGGMTSIFGAVLGAAAVTILPESLRGFHDKSQAVFGIVLMLIVIFMPGGLVSLLRRGAFADMWAWLRRARGPR